MLHNLLLDYDGYDHWELRNTNWENDVDVEHTKLEDYSKQLAAQSRNKSDGFTCSGARKMNPNSYGFKYCDDVDITDTESTETEQFHSCRSILISHYKYLQSNRALRLNLH